jgi:signal transduction histidine kinase
MELNQNYKKRHELERLKDDLLIANVQVAKMAELSERGRIARELHDHAGHDIIAAYISLQVIEELIETDPENAKKIYTEAMRRLQVGIQKVRDTAHNLTPLTHIGLDYFESLCEDFKHCPMELKVYGDTSKVPIYLWSILEPCLKEGLSNILRHSQATKVTVVLDITPYIVRLSIENDGINILSNGKQSPYGMGLRNLRYRAKTVGGNISIDVSQTFKLICVLPLTQNV